MNKYYCDRCSSEIYGKRAQLKLFGTDGGVYPDNDLCNSCFNKLKEFLKNG